MKNGVMGDNPSENRSDIAGFSAVLDPFKPHV
jgi:hypothetical protein